MQPWSSEISHRSSRSLSQDSSYHNQHGFLQSVEQSPSHLHRVKSNGYDSATSGSLSPTTSSPSLGPTSSAHAKQSGLTTLSSSRGSPRNRIEEYENSYLNQPRSRALSELAFEVVSRPRDATGTGVSLLDLPNEILTHVLSHLTPAALSTAALVSHRLHDLVTTPHAWRIAFSRYFRSLQIPSGNADAAEADASSLVAPAFTRLTSFASWRSEYILRTRLLRSLARGKPSDALPAGGRGSHRSSHNAGLAQVTFNSNLLALVNKLHAHFGSGLNKRVPRFVHGAADVGCASSSDPVNHGRVDSWGTGDPQSFLQFDMRFPGDAQYGLGSGELVGVPNSMDVSQAFGMVVGEGCPGGLVYFRHPQEHRGRFLARSLEESFPDLGIPRVDQARETICSVWIAKTPEFATITHGSFSILSGSSMGILTAYSAGTDGFAGQRFERGQLTAKWVLCPGVPITGIAVDDHYNERRCARKRIVAVALNALGEVFVLSEVPAHPFSSNAIKTKLSETAVDKLAWATGRTVRWRLIDNTRRQAREDPYDLSQTDGLYSPRSSSNDMRLSNAEIATETKEIEQFMKEQPKHFQSICHGWDMRRRLEVDFAGDDGHGAGESVFVLDCGFVEGQTPGGKRFTRRVQTAQESLIHGRTNPNRSPPVMGGQAAGYSSDLELDDLSTSEDQIEQWLLSELSFGHLPVAKVLTIAADQSTYATLTMDEDPLLSLAASQTSSPWSTPTEDTALPINPAEVPGQRARFLAAGTNRGTVLLWNMRGPVSSNPSVPNALGLVRTIHTDSPQISCLAVSSLYIVHGGNDGLVQAWDPLGSQQTPTRTLNSRFSSRARRRLIQAEASPWGVGMNLFAAGAICLDPNPTSLRGMVSLGTHLRYWSYSSSAVDPFKRGKRRLRRGERSSNHGADGGFTGSARGALKSYIQDEQREMERETKERRKERARLEGRFGIGLLGPDATEEELLAYATLLSQEGTERSEEEKKQREGSSSGVDEVAKADLPTASQGPDTNFEREVEEAIRLSLQESEQPYSSSPDVPIRYAKGKGRLRSPKTSSPSAAAVAGSSRAAELDDLDFAMQLSLVEEESRYEALQPGTSEDFPALSPASSRGSENSQRRSKGKGKGKMPG